MLDGIKGFIAREFFGKGKTKKEVPEGTKEAERTYLRKTEPAGIDWIRLKPFGQFNEETLPLLRRFTDVLELAKPQKGQRILDAGCGSGWTTEWLARFGPRVVGIDICDDILHLALDRLKKTYRKSFLDKNIPCHFMAGDLEILDRLFRGEAFDSVVLYEALHHVPEWRKVLSGAFSVLKPGGKLIIHEPSNLHSVPEVTEKFGNLERGINPLDIRAFCVEIGFRAVSVYVPHRYSEPKLGLPRRFEPFGIKGLTTGLMETFYAPKEIQRRTILAAIK